MSFRIRCCWPFIDVCHFVTGIVTVRGGDQIKGIIAKTRMLVHSHVPFYRVVLYARMSSCTLSFSNLIYKLYIDS